MRASPSAPLPHLVTSTHTVCLLSPKPMSAATEKLQRSVPPCVVLCSASRPRRPATVRLSIGGCFPLFRLLGDPALGPVELVGREGAKVFDPGDAKKLSSREAGGFQQGHQFGALFVGDGGGRGRLNVGLRLVVKR